MYNNTKILTVFSYIEQYIIIRKIFKQFSHAKRSE